MPQDLGGSGPNEVEAGATQAAGTRLRYVYFYKRKFSQLQPQQWNA